MGKRIRKIEQHLSENVDLYFVYGVGVAVGISTALLLRKSRPTAAFILGKWFKEMEAQGFSIYALDAFQQSIWEERWADIIGGVVGDTTTRVIAEIAIDPIKVKEIAKAVANVV